MSGAVRHWLNQRISSLILIPLVGWLLWATTRLAGADYATSVDFVTRPFNAVMIFLVAIIAFYHAQLGLQVIYEDYVPEPWATYLKSLTRIACIVGWLAVPAAILRLAAGA